MNTENKPLRLIDLINKGNEQLKIGGVENSRREIEWFLCEILSCQRIDLYIQFEDLICESKLFKLNHMVARRLSGEPFQHIIRKASFYGRDFRVNKNVLIPRPETELLIERLKMSNGVNSLLDIGTGSGCISITASLEKLAKNIFATDNSHNAIKIAKENIAKFEVANIKIAFHDFLQSRFKSKFDVVISNPPYIPIDDIPQLQTEVKNYDPIAALTDNKDGLSFYRHFSDQIYNLLNPGGVLILEFGTDKQKVEIEKIFEDAKLKTEFFKDINNNWRAVEVRR